MYRVRIPSLKSESETSNGNSKRKRKKKEINGEQNENVLNIYEIFKFIVIYRKIHKIFFFLCEIILRNNMSIRTSEAEKNWKNKHIQP